MTFIIIQAVFGALSFLFLVFLRRRTVSGVEAAFALYEVLAKESRRSAVKSPPHFNWPAGLFYSTFFYFGLPWLIWRYGIYRGVGLVVVPMMTVFARRSID